MTPPAARQPADFREFIAEYYGRCSSAVPKIRGIAGKWRFEDLVPGLSDFDTRFLLDDSMTISDWCAMSEAVGEVHTSLARARPEWARILEHLPGLNLTVAEITDPRLFYPEFKQWTIYDGKEPAATTIRTHLEATPWSDRDELYHLKKVATYIGPYQRGIDPPINLGAWEDRYPLHSRYMHYFAPPVQSMVSLRLRRTIGGKLEALRLARDLFPDRSVIDRALAAVGSAYADASCDDPALRQVERDLEAYLWRAYATLATSVRLIPVRPDETTQSLKESVSRVPVPPRMKFFEGVRFARLMKGRLRFYAARVESFQSEALIRIELGRMHALLIATPLAAFSDAVLGRSIPWAEALEELVRQGILSPEQGKGLGAVAATVAKPLAPGEERTRAREVADGFDIALSAVETLSARLMEST